VSAIAMSLLPWVISAFSWGELVRVTLREGDANDTILSVTTKRRLATNIIAKANGPKRYTLR
jgi:hypothetical protein